MGRPQTRSIHFQVSTTDFLGDSCHILAPVYLNSWVSEITSMKKVGNVNPNKATGCANFLTEKNPLPTPRLEPTTSDFASSYQSIQLCAYLSLHCVRPLVRWISINEGRGSIEQRYDSRRTQKLFS